MAERSDLMKEAEAAEMLLWSPYTLRNNRARGEGPPYVRLSGGAIRYSRKAITGWINANTITPQGAA